MKRRLELTCPTPLRPLTLPNLSQPRLPVSSPDPQLHVCITIINALKGISHIFAVALLTTGARPRELLNLTTDDIDQRGMVLLKTLKGSDARVVFCPELLKLIPPTPPGQPSLLFRQYSYEKFYRACTGLYEDQLPSLGCHRPLGRLFRSAFASGNLSLASGDLQLVSRSLGHKSSDSTLYYLKYRRVAHG